MKAQRRLPWELTGAIVGAGLASGREVASFFTRYGPWSWGGIVLAVAMLRMLAGPGIPQDGRPAGHIWHGMQALLLMATGGAMLAGAGEVAALTLPIHGAGTVGAAVTLVLACLLAGKVEGGLAAVSRGMLLVLAGMIALGFLLPPMRAVAVCERNLPEGLVRGITYGGFNAALQSPILARYGEIPEEEKRRALRRMCLMSGGVLCLCNAVLMRHPALLGEPMPFIRLMGQYGTFGYAVGALALWLAILSTLVAALKGLRVSIMSVAGILLVASAGLSGVVEVVYPVLGGGCAVLLAVQRKGRRNDEISGTKK